MKKTFSAYVRLSQTRTRETMQAAFQGFAGTAEQAVPGQGNGGTPNRRTRKTGVAVV